MSIVEDLKAQIDAGRITFDPTDASPGRLQRELLGENTGTKVTEKVQKLVLALAVLQKIRISSLIRSEGHHGTGRAVDIGNQEIAADLLPVVTDPKKITELAIDEIIFDAKEAGQTDRNKWNHDRGKPHPYDDKTLDDHKNHIHFAVTE